MELRWPGERRWLSGSLPMLLGLLSHVSAGESSEFKSSLSIVICEGFVLCIL